MTDLITLVTRAQVAYAIPTDDLDAAQSRGLLAGLLAAACYCLAPADFAALLRECDLDPADVDQLLALAKPSPETSEIIDL